MRSSITAVSSEPKGNGGAPRAPARPSGNASRRPLRNDGGQSLLEFILLLPVFIGIFVVMLRSNAASQVSIVNQKHTRETLVRLAFNDPWIAQRGRPSIRDAIRLTKYNRFVVGLSAEEVKTGASSNVASTVNIARSKETATALGQSKDRDSQAEPKERAYVRVRNTLTFCLPMSFDERGNPLVSNFGAAPNALLEQYEPSGSSGSAGSYGDICGGPAEAPGV